MFAINLANALTRDAEVTFVETSPYNPSHKNHCLHLSNKVNLIQLGKSWFGNWVHAKKRTSSAFRLNKLYNWLVQRQLRRILAQRKIDIINSHCRQTDILFTSLNTPIKIVSSQHGHYQLEQDSAGYNDLTTQTLRKLSHIIYSSRMQLDTLKQFNVPDQKVSKIFYGHNLQIPKQSTCFIPGGSLELILVARGIKEKGWEESIQAVINLNKKYPCKLRLHLVGEGYFLDLMKAKYESPQVLFHGFQDDVRNFILNAHIGLLPSYYVAESLPNSVIEYVLCGKPVIASNAGAIPEMLDANGIIAGTIIELKEQTIQTADLELAIETFIKYPETVNLKSRIALQAAEKFRIDSCRDAYLQVFQQLIN